MTDLVVHADCLEALAALPSGIAELVYLDPPFNTGGVLAEANGAFPDRWASLEVYLDFMRSRLKLALERLSSEGVILLHCDWRTCHRFRLLLDDLLGPERFVNHLIWSYGLGGSSPRRFARKHDDILFYARGDRYYFEPPMVPATSMRMKGQLKKATDVLEIPAINNMAHERVGYPTQKPLKLMELLVRACCPPGGIVIDPFCGSGTTLVAAKHLKRRYVGIDVNPDAVAIARARLG